MCVALYPPPEVGGFTATGDKKLSELSTKRNNAIYYTTLLHNKTVLRFCCMHPLLTKQDVQQVVDQINEDLVALGLIKP
ncbi:hypothetical protein [Psychrobacter piechaudii]|uniref:L-2,4-diaminobutyrate decarboxylase n=1 Tax=Psychrobacter piechaudii TaxID=1945521 RepID=A0A1R4G8T5_9GAMM|nr:hypothetical protein [Psychrobacter piechaudii]SJM64422.1 hypothetical protein A1232T_00006 [Psychrobacter piechaudii]